MAREFENAIYRALFTRYIGETDTELPRIPNQATLTDIESRALLKAESHWRGILNLLDPADDLREVAEGRLNRITSRIEELTAGVDPT